MALIPNNPRIGGFMGRMAVPGRPGVGNTGIVPPGFQQRPAEVVGMGTGGALPPSTTPAIQTGGPLPATTAPPIQTGGPLPATSAPPAMNTGGPDPAYPRAMSTGGNLPAMPMGSGSMQPQLPRPPGMPTNSAMTQQRTGPTGLPAQPRNLTGRPAGGLFPRLG